MVLHNMVTMGISAKEEKDARVQQLKKEVDEMVKTRTPMMKPEAIEQQGGGSSDDFQDSSSKEKVVKNRFITDDALEDRICDLYDLYVDGLDEDAGPQVRKLYSELAALWPNGCIDNHEIKRAICRAKDRRKALYRRKDGEAYTYLLNVLAPEHCSPATLDTKDPAERENLVLEHAEKMDCKRYLAPKDIVEGSSNLNLTFVAQIFHQRSNFQQYCFLLSFSVISHNILYFSFGNGLSSDTKKISFAEMMTDDEQMSRDERCFIDVLYFENEYDILD